MDICIYIYIYIYILRISLPILDVKFYNVVTIDYIYYTIILQSRWHLRATAIIFVVESHLLWVGAKPPEF